MSTSNSQQGTAYNLVQDRNNLASGNASPNNKALIKNLRSQSPFNEGGRNKDFVNPTLTSNIVFYDHGNTPVSNPHIDVNKKNPNGYNLNNYVGYEPAKANKKQDAQNLPVRQGGEASSRQYTRAEKRLPVDEEARSVHTDRHYDRSTRSNKSGNNNSDNRSQRSQNSSRSQDNKSQKGGQDNKSQRSTSRNDNASQRSVSQSGVGYQKLSTSNISNPDNLVCDNCVNDKMHQNKLDDLERQRANDREHAQRVGDNIRQQLANEKQRHVEKLRLYQDAIEQQHADHLNRKANERAQNAEEDKKIYNMLAGHDGVLARQQREIEGQREQRRQEFVTDLQDQLAHNNELKQLKAQEQWEEDQRNHNLVIDDAWKDGHRRALKQNYKDNLLNQIDDVNADKNARRQQKADEDADYKQKVADTVEHDKILRQQMDAQKRQIFQDEIQNQLADKRKLAEVEGQIRDLENENHKRKLEYDQQVHLDNLRRKQHQMQDYLNTIGQQMDDNDLKKQLAQDELKKPGNTTLLLNEKQHKCYNCAKCKGKYPLKFLNKRKRVK